jgi:hypothetical protein
VQYCSDIICFGGAPLYKLTAPGIKVCNFAQRWWTTGDRLIVSLLLVRPSPIGNRPNRNLIYQTASAVHSQSRKSFELVGADFR